MAFLDDYKRENPDDPRVDLELIRDYGAPGSGYRNMYPELGGAWDKMFRPSLGQEFGTGLDRGIELTKAMGYGLAGYTSDFFGFEDLRRDMIKGYQSSIRQAGKFKTTVDFTTAMNTGEFDDYIQWAAGGFGELAPNIAVTVGGSLLGGGAGALITGSGRQALLRSAERTLGANVVSKLTRELGEEGAEKFLLGSIDKLKNPLLAAEAAAMRGYGYGSMANFQSGAFRGSQFGAFTSGIGLNLGEVYGGVAGDEDVDQRNVSRGERLAVGGAGGIAAGLLDFLGPNILLQRIFRRPSISAGATREVSDRVNAAFMALGTHMVVEGATEGSQEAIAEWAKLIADEDKQFDPEAFKKHVTEAAALGTLAGFGFGSAGGTVEFFRGSWSEPENFEDPTSFGEESLPTTPTAPDTPTDPTDPEVSERDPSSSKFDELRIRSQNKLNYDYLTKLQRKVIARSGGPTDVSVLSDVEKGRYRDLMDALKDTEYARFLDWRGWGGFNEVVEGELTGESTELVKVLSDLAPMKRNRTFPDTNIPIPVMFRYPYDDATDEAGNYLPYRMMRIPTKGVSEDDPGVRMLPVTAAEFDGIMENPTTALNAGIEMIREAEVDADTGAAIFSDSGRMALLNLNRIKTGWDRPELWDTPEGDPSLAPGEGSEASIISDPESPDAKDGHVSLPGDVIVALNADRFKEEMADPDSTAAYIVGQIAMDPEAAPSSLIVEPGEVSVVPGGQAAEPLGTGPAPIPTATRRSVHRVGEAYNRAVYGEAKGRDAFSPDKEGLKASKAAAKGREIPAVVWGHPIFGLKDDLATDAPMYIRDVVGRGDKRVIKARFRNSDKDYEFGWDDLRGAWFHPGYDTNFRDALWTAVLDKLAEAWKTDVENFPADEALADPVALLNPQMADPESEVGKFYKTTGSKILEAYYPKLIQDMLKHVNRPRTAIEGIIEMLERIPDYGRADFISRLQVDQNVKEALFSVLKSGDLPKLSVADLVADAAGIPRRSKIPENSQKEYEQDLQTFKPYKRAKHVRDTAALAKTQAFLEAGKGNPPSSSEMYRLVNEAEAAEHNLLAMERLFLHNELQKVSHSEAAVFLARGKEGFQIPDTREGFEGESLVVSGWEEAAMETKAFERGDVEERTRFNYAEQLAKLRTPLEMDSIVKQVNVHLTMVRRHEALGLLLARMASLKKRYITKSDIVNRYKSLLWTPMAAKFSNDKAAYIQQLANVLEFADKPEYKVVEGKVAEDAFLRAAETWDVLVSNLINRGLLMEVRDLHPSHASAAVQEYNVHIDDLEKSIELAGNLNIDLMRSLRDSLKQGLGVPQEVRESKKGNNPVASVGIKLTSQAVGATEEGAEASAVPLYIGQVGEGDAPTALTNAGLAQLEDLDPAGGRAMLIEVIPSADGSLTYHAPLDMLQAMYFARDLVQARSRGVYTPVDIEGVDEGSYLAFRSEQAVQEVLDQFSSEEGKVNFVHAFHPLTTMTELNAKGFTRKHKKKGDSSLAVLVEDRGMFRIKTISMSSSTWIGGRADIAASKKDIAEIDRQLREIPEENTIARLELSRKKNEIEADLKSKSFWRTASTHRDEAATTVADMLKGWPARIKEIKEAIAVTKDKTEKAVLEKELVRLENYIKFEEDDVKGLDADKITNGIKSGIDALKEFDEDGNLVNPGATSVPSLWESMNKDDFKTSNFLQVEGLFYDVEMTPSLEAVTGWEVPPEFSDLEAIIRQSHSAINWLELAQDELASIILPDTTADLKTRDKAKVTEILPLYKVGVPAKVKTLDKEKVAYMRREHRKGRWLANKILQLADDSPDAWKLIQQRFDSKEEAEAYLKETHVFEIAELKKEIAELQAEAERQNKPSPDNRNETSRGEWTLRDYTDEMKKQFVALDKEGYDNRIQLLRSISQGGGRWDNRAQMSSKTAEVIAKKISQNPKAFAMFWMGLPVEIQTQIDTGEPSYSQPPADRSEGDVELLELDEADFYAEDNRVSGDLVQQGPFMEELKTGEEVANYADWTTALGQWRSLAKKEGATKLWIAVKLDSGKAQLWQVKPVEGEKASFQLLRAKNKLQMLGRNLNDLDRTGVLSVRDIGTNIKGEHGKAQAGHKFVALRARGKTKAREKPTDLEPGIWIESGGALNDFRVELDGWIKSTAEAGASVFHGSLRQNLLHKLVESFSRFAEIQSAQTEMQMWISSAAAGIEETTSRKIEYQVEDAGELLQRHAEILGEAARTPGIRNLIENKPAIQQMMAGGLTETSQPDAINDLSEAVYMELNEIRNNLSNELLHYRKPSKIQPHQTVQDTESFDVSFKDRSSFVRIKDSDADGVTIKQLLMDAGLDPRLTPPGSRAAAKLNRVFETMNVHGVIELVSPAELDLVLSKMQVNNLISTELTLKTKQAAPDWVAEFESVLTHSKIRIGDRTVDNPFLNTKDGKNTIARELHTAIVALAEDFSSNQNQPPTKRYNESNEDFAARLAKYKAKWWEINDFKAFLFNIPGVVETDSKQHRTKKDFAPKFHRILADAHALSQNNELVKLNKLIVGSFLRSSKNLYWGLFTTDRLAEIMKLPQVPSDSISLAMRGKKDFKASSAQYRGQILALRLREGMGLITEADGSLEDDYRDYFNLVPTSLIEQVRVAAAENNAFEGVLEGPANDPAVFKHFEGRESDAKRAFRHWLNKAGDDYARLNNDPFQKDGVHWRVVRDPKEVNKNWKQQIIPITKAHLDVFKQAETTRYLRLRAKYGVAPAQREYVKDKLKVKERELKAILSRTDPEDESSPRYQQELIDIQEELATDADMYSHLQRLQTQLNELVDQRMWISPDPTGKVTAEEKAQMLDSLDEQVNNLQRDVNLARGSLKKFHQEHLFTYINNAGMQGRSLSSGLNETEQSYEGMVELLGNKAEASVRASNMSTLFSEEREELSEVSDQAEAMADFLASKNLAEAFEDSGGYMGETDDPHSVLFLDPNQEDYFDVFPNHLVTRLYEDIQKVDPKGFVDANSVQEWLSGKSFKSGLFATEPYSTYIRHAAVNLYLSTKKAGTDLANALKFDALANTFKKEALQELLSVEARVRKAYSQLFARAWIRSRQTVNLNNNARQYNRAVERFGLNPSTFFQLGSVRAAAGAVFRHLDRLLDPAQGGTPWNVTKIFDAIYLLTGRNFGGIVGRAQHSGHAGTIDPDLEGLGVKPQNLWRAETIGGQELTPAEQQEYDETGEVKNKDSLGGPREFDLMGRMFMRGDLTDLAAYSAKIERNPGAAQSREEIETQIEALEKALRKVSKKLRTSGLNRNLTGVPLPNAIRVQIKKKVFGLNINRKETLDWDSLPSYITDLKGTVFASEFDPELGDWVQSDEPLKPFEKYPPKRFLRDIYEKRELKNGIAEGKLKKLYNKGDLIPEGHPEYAWTQEEKDMRDVAILELEEQRATRLENLDEQKRAIQGALNLREKIGELQAELFNLPSESFGWHKNDDGSPADTLNLMDLVKHYFPSFFTQVEYKPQTELYHVQEMPVPAEEVMVGDSPTILLAPYMEMPDGSAVPDRSKIQGPFTFKKFLELREAKDEAGNLKPFEEGGLGGMLVWSGKPKPVEEGQNENDPQRWEDRNNTPWYAAEDEIWDDGGPAASYHQLPIDTSQLVWEGPLVEKDGPMEGIVNPIPAHLGPAYEGLEGALVTPIFVTPDNIMFQGGPHTQRMEGGEVVPTDFESLEDFFSRMQHMDPITGQMRQLTQVKSIPAWKILRDSVSPEALGNMEGKLIGSKAEETLLKNEVQRLSEKLVALNNRRRDVDPSINLTKDSDTKDLVAMGAEHDQVLKEIGDITNQLKVTQKKLKRLYTPEDRAIEKHIIDWEAVVDAGYFIGEAINYNGQIFVRSSLRAQHEIIKQPFFAGGKDTRPEEQRPTITVTTRLAKLDYEWRDEEEAWKIFKRETQALDEYRRVVRDTRALRELQDMGGQGLLTEANQDKSIDHWVKEAQKWADKMESIRKWLNGNEGKARRGHIQAEIERNIRSLEEAEIKFNQAQHELLILGQEPLTANPRIGNKKQWLKHANPTLTVDEALNPLGAAFDEAFDGLASEDEQINFFKDQYLDLHRWLVAEGKGSITYDKTTKLLAPESIHTQVSGIAAEDMSSVLTDLALEHLQYSEDEIQSDSLTLFEILTNLEPVDSVPIIEDFQHYVATNYAGNLVETRTDSANAFAKLPGAAVLKALQGAYDGNEFGRMIQKAVLKDDTISPESKRVEDINMVADVPLSFYHPDKGWVHPSDIPGSSTTEILADLFTTGDVELNGALSAFWFRDMDKVDNVHPEDTPWPSSKGYQHMMPPTWTFGKTDAAELLRALKPVKDLRGAIPAARLTNVVKNLLLRFQKAAEAQGKPFLESINAYISPSLYHIDRDGETPVRGQAKIYTPDILIHDGEAAYEGAMHEVTHQILHAFRRMVEVKPDPWISSYRKFAEAHSPVLGLTTGQIKRRRATFEGLFGELDDVYSRAQQAWVTRKSEKNAADTEFMLNYGDTVEHVLSQPGPDEFYTAILTNPVFLNWALTVEGNKRTSLWHDAILAIINWFKELLGQNIVDNSLGEEAWTIAMEIAEITADNWADIPPASWQHWARYPQRAKTWGLKDQPDIQYEDVYEDRNLIADDIPRVDTPAELNPKLVRLAINRELIAEIMNLADETGLLEDDIYGFLGWTKEGNDPRKRVAKDMHDPLYKTGGIEDQAFVGKMSEANNDAAKVRLQQIWHAALKKKIIERNDRMRGLETRQDELSALTEELRLIHGPGRDDGAALLDGIKKATKQLLKRAELESAISVLGDKKLDYTSDIKSMLEGAIPITASEADSVLRKLLNQVAGGKIAWEYFQALANLTIDWKTARPSDVARAVKNHLSDAKLTDPKRFSSADERQETLDKLKELGLPKNRALLAVLASLGKHSQRIMVMFDNRTEKTLKVKQKLRAQIEKLERGDEDYITVRNELTAASTRKKLTAAEKLIQAYADAAHERKKLADRVNSDEKFRDQYDNLIERVNGIAMDYGEELGVLREFITIDTEGSYAKYFVFKPSNVEEDGGMMMLKNPDADVEEWVHMPTRTQILERKFEHERLHKREPFKVDGLAIADLDIREEKARERFLKHVGYNVAWLRENPELKNTSLYRQVDSMVDKLMAMNLRKNLFEVRGAGFWEGIGRLMEAPVARLRRAGVPSAWELARRLHLYADVMLKYTPEAKVQASKLSGAFRKAAEAAGFGNDHAGFTAEIYRPLSVQLNRAPYIESMEGALKLAKEFYAPALAARKFDEVKFQRALAKLLEVSRVNGKWYNSIRDELKIGVARRGSREFDPITGQERMLHGRAMEKGFSTTPLRLTRQDILRDYEILTKIEGVPTASNPFSIALADGIEQLITDPALSSMITRDVLDILIEPLFTEFEHLVPFGRLNFHGTVSLPVDPSNPESAEMPVPVEEFLMTHRDKEGNAIDPSEIATLRDLWEVMIGNNGGLPSAETTAAVSGEQVLSFLDVVALLSEQDSTLEEISFEDRRAAIFGRIRGQFMDMRKLGINAEMTEDANIFNPGAGHFIIDARTNPFIPRKYYDLVPHDETGVQLSLKKLAITKAFGRDALEANRLFAKLQSHIQRRQRDVDQEFGENSEESHKYRSFARVLVDKDDGVRAVLNRAFNSGQGEMQDIPAFIEALGLVVQGTLAGPRSWVLQSQSQTILPFLMGGWTKQSRKALAQSFKTMGKSMINDWGKVFSMDIASLSREEQYMKDLIFQTEFENLDWEEYAKNDVGYRFAYQRKGRKGFNWQRVLRIIQKRLSKGNTLLPWNGFKVWSKSTTLGNAVGIMKSYVDAARTLALYFKGTPAALNNPAFQLVEEEQLMKRLYGGNVRGITWLATKGLEYMGKTIDEVAREMLRRGELGESVLDEGMLRGLIMMSQGETTGDGSINTRPGWAKGSEVGRLASTITGWSLWQTNQVVENSRDQGEKAAWGYFALNMSLTAVPIAVVWALFLDEFDRKVRGKAPYARQFSSELSAWKNVQALIDKVDRTGQLGLIGSMVNYLGNYSDPRRGIGRGVAIERIFVLSVLDNFMRSMQRGILQGGFDWQVVTRGVPGLSGAIQWLQISNTMALSLGLPPISAAEQSLTDKINAKRYLMAAGEQLGLEIRPPGTTMPSEQAYYTSLMYRAALADDSEAFREYYVAAMRRYGEVSDTPEKSVKNSWRSRHPLNNIFRAKPDEKQLRRLFNLMPSDGKKGVKEALRLYEKYDKLITAYGT